MVTAASVATLPIRKAVVPVAGPGTRLLPATKSQPKEMLPVGRKPTVQYVVEEMAQAGITQILFVTGRKKESIEDHFDRDPDLERRLSAAEDELRSELDTTSGLKFFYTRQSAPTGSADAVRQAEQFVGDEPFVVAFGDTIIRSGGRRPAGWPSPPATSSSARSSGPSPPPCPGGGATCG